MTAVADSVPVEFLSAATLAEPTYQEQLATSNGYPVGLFGYSPNEHQYWHESLPWVNDLLNPESHGLNSETCVQELAQLRGPLVCWNDNMAPRFRHGTVLAGVLLAENGPQPGDVLVWWKPGEAADCFEIARVAKIEEISIRLAYDNGGRAVRLPWPLLPGYKVLLITHYLSQPFENLH